MSYGWLGQGWTNEQLALGASLLAGGVLAAAAARTVPRTARAVPWGLAGVALVALPRDHVAIGITAVLIALPACAGALRSLRLRRRGRRPWFLVGLTVLLAGWLGASGLPWCGLAVTVATIGCWTVGSSPRRARAYVWPVATMDAVLVLTVLGIALRVAQSPRGGAWMPVAGAWMDGLYLLAVAALMARLGRDWRSQVRGVVVGTVAAACAWTTWPTSDLLDAVVWQRLPVVESSLGATFGAKPVDARTGVETIMRTIEPVAPGEIWIRVGFPLAPLAVGFGTVVLCAHEPSLESFEGYRAAPANGSLQDALDLCGGQGYCRVRLPPEAWNR